MCLPYYQVTPPEFFLLSFRFLQTGCPPAGGAFTVMLYIFLIIFFFLAIGSLLRSSFYYHFVSTNRLPLRGFPNLTYFLYNHYHFCLLSVHSSGVLIAIIMFLQTDSPSGALMLKYFIIIIHFELPQRGKLFVVIIILFIKLHRSVLFIISSK